MKLLPYLIEALKVAGWWIMLFVAGTAIICGTLYVSVFVVPVLIWHM